MKKFNYILCLLFCTLIFCQKKSDNVKTSFSKDALSQKMTTVDGKKVAISEILNAHKGEIVMIDLWASWCQDCIKAMPRSKQLVVDNPNVTVLYFSLDKDEKPWKKGIEKHGLSDKQNFWFDEGWKNAFNNEIELDWIPRIMILDKEGNIALYSAISPDDVEIQKVIDQLNK